MICLLKTKKKLGYGQTQKPSVENKVEEEAKKQQQDNTIPEIKLMYEGRRLKGFRVPDNLNGVKFSREQYGDKWKRKDVRPTNLVDFEHVAKHYNINIMLYELKAKDTGSMGWLVYGKTQYKSDVPTFLWDYWQVIKKGNALCKRWGCKSYKQIFMHGNHLIRYFKEERRTGGKTKIICSGCKFGHILNSSEKVYGGDTLCS